LLIWLGCNYSNINQGDVFVENFGPMVLLLLGVVAVVFFLKILKSQGNGGKDLQNLFPYQKEPTLFTPAERSFLGVLEQAIGDQFRIMGKVRLADIIRVRPGLSASARQTAFNKISAKHVDFAAFDPDTLAIQFAVELDDQSHSKQSRKDRDAFLDGALAAASVPLIRFPARKTYTMQEVEDTLLSHLEINNSESITQQVEITPSDESDNQTLICPLCGGDMVRRKASRGKNAGNEFWGCSNYPKCRQVL
jgi:very-short-patch-repair endonuclease